MSTSHSSSTFKHIQIPVTSHSLHYYHRVQATIVSKLLFSNCHPWSTLNLATGEIFIKHKSNCVTPLLKIHQWLPSSSRWKPKSLQGLTGPSPSARYHAARLLLLSASLLRSCPLASLMFLVLTRAFIILLIPFISRIRHVAGIFSCQGFGTCSLSLAYPNHRNSQDSFPHLFQALTQMSPSPSSLFKTDSSNTLFSSLVLFFFHFSLYHLIIKNYIACWHFVCWLSPLL